MAPVAILTEDDLHVRRDKALGRLTVTEDDLRARAEGYRLTAVELAVLTELDDIDFLLGVTDA